MRLLSIRSSVSSASDEFNAEVTFNCNRDEINEIHRHNVAPCEFEVKPKIEPKAEPPFKHVKLESSWLKKNPYLELVNEPCSVDEYIRKITEAGRRAYFTTIDDMSTAKIKKENNKSMEIIFNPPATILIKDGKKYVSKAHGEEFDEEKGLLMCLCKANGISHLELKRMIKNAKKQVKKEKKKEKDAEV